MCIGTTQWSALTGLRVRVAVALSAAVGRGLLIVLVLREAQRQGLGGAAAGLLLPLQASGGTAALLRTIREVKGHAPLCLLKHKHINTRFSLRGQRLGLGSLRCIDLKKH